MKVLDLFSGIGGFSLGLERAGMETVAFCEIEKFPQKVLKKHWPEIPIYDDIRKLTREQLTKDGIGAIDLVCGGFPCQPFSAAGKREGFKDDRDLWPEMFRVIQEVRPRWIIGENVAGFINMGLDRTLSDLEGAGYRTEQVVIPACAIGAPHRRDRIWIVARDTKSERIREIRGVSEGKNANSGGICKDGHAANTGDRCGGDGKSRIAGEDGNRELQEGIWTSKAIEAPGSSEASRAMADTKGEQIERKGPGGLQPKPPQCGGRFRHWDIEPPVGRMANGIPDRTHRLKGLGNAVVPQIPEIIGRAIMEIERTK